MVLGRRAGEALHFFARGLEVPNPRRRVIREERDETRRLARSFRTIRARLAARVTAERLGGGSSDCGEAWRAWTAWTSERKPRMRGFGRKKKIPLGRDTSIGIHFEGGKLESTRVKDYARDTYFDFLIGLSYMKL